MNPIAGALASVFAILFGLIANILGTITGAFLGIAVAIFNWVSSPGFISLSYTRLDNPFIEVGWTLTRDLTNIFFVLALVVIGLGTALRLTGYQAQKALPTLIIIALLINFTPVILGLIVDASNIVMNFFVQGGFAGANSFANYATSQWSNLSVLFDLETFWNPIDKVSAAAGSIVLIFFNLIAALIYLLFALIFILRYVAIWVLVILSPFAFACYIFPATKKVFSQWWQQFIQWSLIGAIAAFFLYLGDHFIKMATDPDSPLFKSSLPEIVNAPGLAPIMNGILPYFVAIAFLFIGLIMSLTFAPKGADAIIKGGQRGMKAGGKVLGTRAWKGVKETAKASGRVFGGPSVRAGREAYRIHRGLGKTRKQALGAAMERGWAAARLETGWRTKAEIKATPGAVARGTWRAIKDSAHAGWGAAWGLKRKGKKKCPYCGQMIAASAKICPMPGCGADLG